MKVLTYQFCNSAKSYVAGLLAIIKTQSRFFRF